MKKKITTPKKPGKSQSRKSPGVNNNAKPSTEESWMMRLYVAGQSARSLAAIANLRQICDTHMPGRCTIEVIDHAQSRARQGRSDRRNPDAGQKTPDPGKAHHWRSFSYG